MFSPWNHRILINHYILQDNVIATPHMAAMTFSSHEEMQCLRAAENVWAVI